MDISVVIVNWNTKAFVLDCIQSIRSRSQGLQIEIIVVDNASQDGSPEAIRQQFPEVHLVENSTNCGFARGNNIGMARARGRYVCLVNSDCVVLDGCFQRLHRYMEDHADVGIVGPKLLWKDRTLQLSCRKLPSLWNALCPALGLTKIFPGVPFLSGEHMGYFGHDEIRDVDVLVGAFLMVRKSAVDAVGGMDESYFMYCEEVDWCKRFVKAGWRVVFNPEAEAIHHGGGSSANEPTRCHREYCLSNLKYWRKHHSRPRELGFRAILLLRYAVRLPCWRLAQRLSGSRREWYRQKVSDARTALSVALAKLPAEKPGCKTPAG